MNESELTVRPTKKQRELLGFIESFIAEHGYSPSYREIMNGLEYTSVATVALHVGNLIKRGHIRKRDRSARSLEVVASSTPPAVTSNKIEPGEEKWLVGKVEHHIAQAEAAGIQDQSGLENLAILIGALRVLGLEGAAASFAPRLQELARRQGSES